jgi:hypothetical protein
MSGNFAHLVRCLDVRERDVADAVQSRDATKALLAHLSACSAPNTGTAKVLLVFARMATTACDWIDGDLQIELFGDDALTVIEAQTELGGGLRERLFPPTSFRAPLVEFTRAIERVPHLIAPLAIRDKSAQRISLSAMANVRRTSVPPPPIEISAESLFVRLPAPAVPREEHEPLGLPVVAAEATPSALAVEVEPEPAIAPTTARPPGEPLIADVDQGWED